VKIDPVDLYFAALILVAYALPFAAMHVVSTFQERKRRAAQKTRLGELTGR
jgi:hypothetical protein